MPTIAVGKAMPAATAAASATMLMPPLNMESIRRDATKLRLVHRALAGLGGLADPRDGGLDLAEKLDAIPEAFPEAPCKAAIRSLAARIRCGVGEKRCSVEEIQARLQSEENAQARIAEMREMAMLEAAAVETSPDGDAVYAARAILAICTDSVKKKMGKIDRLSKMLSMMGPIDAVELDVVNRGLAAFKAELDEALLKNFA